MAKKTSQAHVANITDKEKEISKELATVEHQLKTLVIKDSKSLKTAQILLATLKGGIKNINATFGPLVDANTKALEEARKLRDKYLVPAKQTAKILADDIGTYVDQETQRKRDEADRLQQEAEAEAAKKANAKAKRLEKQGRIDEAEVARTDYSVPVIHVEASVEMEANSYVRKTWAFEIIDEAVIPREYLTPDTKLIGQIVKAQKDKTNISGIRVFSNSTGVVRTVQ